MQADIPQYVVERIRESPPYDACVVSGSTPIIAFGSVHGARVATLGLNPSRQEFLDTYGREQTKHTR